MEGSNYVTVKRGNPSTKSDADLTKIKRSENPQDIHSARRKEDGVEKDGDDGENDHKATKDDEDSEEEVIKGDLEQEKDDEGRNGRGTEYSKNQQPRRHVSHGHHLVEGKMKHGMEDYLVAENKKMDGRELGLYAIFDGHSGSRAAEYLQSHLIDNILNQPDFWTNTKTAVQKAYQETDNDILENVVGAKGGSTAVTAILINRETLVVANVGDSRAILCKNGTAKPVTVDHDPMKENELVESRGGFVFKKAGNVPRVDGQLTMTRAFGDGRLKEHITAEPNIVIENVDEDTEFIVLASDGLWKVMSNQEAVDCVRGLKDGQEAAEKLIKEALLRKSSDDISCVVVMFG